MPKSLVKYRHQAFLNQSERCYYCGFVMWEGNPDAFAARHKMSLAQASRFQCTAEHLKARQDGGSDSQSNIVAACAYCNRGRHKMKNAPSPEAMRRHVEKRLANGLWNAAIFTNGAQHPSAQTVTAEPNGRPPPRLTSFSNSHLALQRHQ